MKSIQINERYISALKTFNLNVESALSEFIILNILKKISEFENECELFKKKYKVDYNSFEARIKDKINEEDFEEEDDYMAWKFAEENKKLLKNRLEEIQ